MHKAHKNKTKKKMGCQKWVTLYVSTPRVQDFPSSWGWRRALRQTERKHGATRSAEDAPEDSAGWRRENQFIYSYANVLYCKERTLSLTNTGVHKGRLLEIHDQLQSSHSAEETCQLTSEIMLVHETPVCFPTRKAAAEGLLCMLHILTAHHTGYRPNALRFQHEGMELNLHVTLSYYLQFFPSKIKSSLYSSY